MPPGGSALQAVAAFEPEAASTDISKIVRLDYGADSLLTEWMERALPLWRAFNARCRSELFHEDGFLALASGPMRTGEFEHDSFATLRARGHLLQRLDGGSVAARFPAWDGARYPDGYFNPRGGWVESGRALGLLIDEARVAGVRVHAGVPVARLVEQGSRVAGIETAAGERLAADVVLVAAGAWTSVMLPELSGAMWPVAQPVFHLKPDDPDAWRPPGFTVWAAAIGKTGWYGFPANASGIVKIANHGPGRRVDPDAPRVIAPGDEDRLRAFLRDNLPGLAAAPLAASKTCLYSDSFDGDFWMGRDPERPGLAVAAGDSGHGFKFAPVLGDVIADAIEEKASPLTARFAWRMPAARKAEAARFGLS